MSRVAPVDLATRARRPAASWHAGPARAGTTIVDLDEARLPDAARMFASAHRRLRDTVTALPASPGSPDAILPRLRGVVADGGAVAAVRDGEVVGYLAGLGIDGLRGPGTASWVPEWAHGADGPSRVETWHALYAAASERWIREGRAVHCVTILADDATARDALGWLGFGLFSVDGIAPVSALPDADPPPGVTVDRAAPGDRDRLAGLAVAHDAWYGGAPIFLYRDPGDPPVAALEGWLSAPGEAVLVARVGDRPVGFLYLRPPGSGAASVVRHPSTIAIGGAFTAPDARGTGIGRALLSAARAWAAGAGYARVSVDYETANLPARRFWRRWFSPVCLSFERHVDVRLCGGPKGAAR